MAQRRKKHARERGKIKLSQYFQKLETGDKVALKQEKSVQKYFPLRYKGKVGVIKEKRGRAYLVSIKDGRKEKIFIVHPINLVKLKLN